MKKVIIVFALALIFASVFTSCKSKKAPCPAYRGMYKSANIDNIDKQDKLKSQANMESKAQSAPSENW